MDLSNYYYCDKCMGYVRSGCTYGAFDNAMKYQVHCYYCASHLNPALFYLPMDLNGTGCHYWVACGEFDACPHCNSADLGHYDFTEWTVGGRGLLYCTQCFVLFISFTTLNHRLVQFLEQDITAFFYSNMCKQQQARCCD